MALTPGPGDRDRHRHRMTTRQVYLETFGCQMNELDSELVAGKLRTLGYVFTPESERADVVLYNTCSVREHAEQKVWSRLGEMKREKESRPGLVVGVLGCMAERDGAGLVDRMPVVDVLCGPGELDKLPALLDNAVRTREAMLADGARGAAGRSARQIALQGDTSRRSATLAAAQDDLELLDLSRSISAVDPAGGRTAYVRITRGCNKFCTYCVVPFTRGAEVHRPPEHIVEECRRLADAGVIEITLLGQTVNHYRFEHGASVTVNGVTQPQKGRTYRGLMEEGVRRDAYAGERVTTFADLLSMIHERVPEIQRLRFVTSYPRDFGDDVLSVIRDHPRICRYLHAPAQSGSDTVLKRMNRGYTIGEYDEFISRARAFLDQPEIGRPLMLSGDIIVGFPGETDEDFEATVALVERSRYKNCFIFKYSPRPGTTAFDKLVDDVPEGVKRTRNNRLLAVQAAISDSIAREQIGRSFDVLVEGLSRRERKRRGVDVKPGGGMVHLTVSAGGAAAPDAGVATAVADESAAGDTVQLAARTDGDLIVHIDVPSTGVAGVAGAPGASAESLVGTIRRCRIVGGSGLSLRGELVADGLRDGHPRPR